MNSFIKNADTKHAQGALKHRKSVLVCAFGVNISPTRPDLKIVPGGGAIAVRNTRSRRGYLPCKYAAPVFGFYAMPSLICAAGMLNLFRMFFGGHVPCLSGTRIPMSEIPDVFMSKRFNPLKWICRLPFWAFCFAACASTFPEPAIAPAQARRFLESHENALPDAMRLRAKIDYVDESGGRRVVGQDFVVSLKKDGRMRMTLSAFDKAVAALVTDGVGFALMDVSQNAYVTGLASAENIARILPVSLSAEDLWRVLRGQFPEGGLAADALSRAAFGWDEKAGGYRLDLPLLDGARQSVFYAWPSGDAFKIQVSKAGRVLSVYEASEFAQCSGGTEYRHPRKIIFRLPESRTNVRLRVEGCDADVEFSDAVFKLPPPAGARMIVLTPDG